MGVTILWVASGRRGERLVVDGHRERGCCVMWLNTGSLQLLVCC